MESSIEGRQEEATSNVTVTIVVPNKEAVNEQKSGQVGNHPAATLQNTQMCVAIANVMAGQRTPPP